MKLSPIFLAAAVFLDGAVVVSAVEQRSRHLRVAADDAKIVKNAQGPASGRALTSPTAMVVTLGDSYASGTGIYPSGDDYDEEYGGSVTYNGVTYKMTVRSDNECWRETQDTPGPRLATDYNQPSVFLACKGAEASHVTRQFDYLKARYPTESTAGWPGSTIILTAGGNDIRTNDGMDWPELLEHCITTGFFFGTCSTKSGNQIANFSTMQSRLTTLFRKIAAEAGQATIRVLGYPKLMQRDPRCGSVTGINKAEADWMDDQVILLNNRIINAVNSAKASYPNVNIKFVNVYNYLTVGACGDGPSNRHVHDKILDGIKTSDSSFHPSDKGYDQYYLALKTNP